jgi:thiol-disulfide isomerase/thioredoxin
VYLGYYYAESTYARDTAVINSKGEFTFEGKDALPQGMYFIAKNKTRLFEMVVGANQRFKMESSADDYIRNMKVSGDLDNKLFFENMLFNMDRNKEAEPFIKILQDSTLTDEQKKDAREGFAKVNEKVIAYQNTIIEKYPKTVTAALFAANKRIDIPEPPKRADGTVDSTFQLRWYREHFFDYFDLSNDALIRVNQSLYSKKVNEYLDKLYAPDPDSVMKAIDFMVAKAKPNQETFKYLVWTCMIKYQQPEIMGQDEIYVRLFDKYFASGQMDFWVSAKLKKNIKDFADRLRLSLVGQTAKNLILQDGSGKLRSMYDLKNKYTIVYFFDPDCGHCKTETPKVVNFLNNTTFDVAVYAVSADSSLSKMNKYVKDMKMEKFVTTCFYYSAVGHYQSLYDAETTPTLYVLDDKKKIIAKKLPAERLQEFLTNYEKFQAKKLKNRSNGTTP